MSDFGCSNRNRGARADPVKSRGICFRIRLAYRCPTSSVIGRISLLSFFQRLASCIWVTNATYRAPRFELIKSSETTWTDRDTAWPLLQPDYRWTLGKRAPCVKRWKFRDNAEAVDPASGKFAVRCWGRKNVTSRPSCGWFLSSFVRFESVAYCAIQILSYVTSSSWMLVSQRTQVSIEAYRLKFMYDCP